jgi:hypothetical protein
MQQTTLPHRVARSVKDLASATLSGATFELKDPRESKYEGPSSSHASNSFEHLSSGSIQQRPGIYARGSSFRNETNDVQWRKAEEDFERFQQLDDFQSEFTACLASLNNTIAPQESSHGLQSDSILESDHMSNQILEPGETSKINLDQSTSRHELASESISKRDADFARTAALRRLNQIGAHLQRNLAMQTLQQEDADVQSHVFMSGTKSIVLDELTRQADDGVRNATRTDEAESSSHGVRNVVLSQHQDQIANIDSPPKSPSEEEDNVLQRQFHCPYYACHRNLKLHSTSSSSSSQRQCVHVGCDFTTETFSSLAEHIHVPHHDLLGSV